MRVPYRPMTVVPVALLVPVVIAVIAPPADSVPVRMPERLKSAMTLSGSLSRVPSVRTLPMAGVPVSSVTLLTLSVAMGGSFTAVSVIVPVLLSVSGPGPPAFTPTPTCTLLPSFNTTV